MDGSNAKDRADNVIVVDFRRRGAVARSRTLDPPPPLASVYSKITDNNEVEYGMIDVDARAAPRLMRALLVLMDELMDVASM